MSIKLQWGDTLSGIAAKFKTTVQALAQANGIADPNKILAGDNLKIPGDNMASGIGGQRYQGYSGNPGTVPANFPFKMDEEAIAKALGVSKENVQRYWPPLANALNEAGITDSNSIMAVLATIRTEVGDFAPIPEEASGSAYEGRSDLGNTEPGDGVRYKGRGFIQLTGRANYREYGQKLGIDLENNPDLALDPTVSCKILVQYFKDRGIDNLAANGDWRGVRKAVNGGYNGWDTFAQAVDSLQNNLA